MRFLIAEDDYLQADWLEEALRSRYPDSIIDSISTEYEFIERVECLKRDPPDLALIDVMLRWTNPASQLPEQPSDVKEGGYYRAGLRCVHRLREMAETSDTPVILYTVLADSDIEESELERLSNFQYLKKDTDPENLFEAIGKVTLSDQVAASKID